MLETVPDHNAPGRAECVGVPRDGRVGNRHVRDGAVGVETAAAHVIKQLHVINGQAVVAAGRIDTPVTIRGVGGKVADGHLFDRDAGYPVDEQNTAAITQASSVHNGRETIDPGQREGFVNNDAFVERMRGQFDNVARRSRVDCGLNGGEVGVLRYVTDRQGGSRVDRHAHRTRRGLAGRIADHHGEGLHPRTQARYRRGVTGRSLSNGARPAEDVAVSGRAPRYHRR